MHSTRSRKSALANSSRSALSYVPPRFRKINDERIKTTSRINKEFASRNAQKVDDEPIDIHSIVYGDSDVIRSRDIPIDEVFENEKIDEDVEKENPGKVFVTFDLLKSTTPKNCIKYLSNNPIFLRTLILEGSLDQDIISSVALSLTQNELQKFILNMTQEINFFTAIQTCQTIAELEAHIPKLITMQRATVWTRIENSEYLTSSSLKEVLPISQSCVGVPFIKKDDYRTGDPGNFQNFSITHDLSLLRGVKSMLLLPITTPADEVVAVLQCVGLRNPITDEQVEFSDYYFETFKIVRDLIQKRFFALPAQRVLPSTVSCIFSEIESGLISNTAKQIQQFFMNTIPCEACDLFEFDDRYRCLNRLTTGESYGEVEGGVSFAAGLSSTVINIPHGQSHPSLSKETDGKFVNRSILSKSIQQGRSHYVVTLRAKPNAPSFSSADSMLISEMTPLITDSLKLAKFIEDQSTKTKELENEKHLLSSAVEMISSIASSGVNSFNALETTAKNLFGCDRIFVCIFDGRYMKYFPTDVKSKFEECSAGQAYNYRETVWTRKDDVKQKYSAEIYKQLNVDWKSSISFPYRANAKVVGAIELINPTRMEIDKEEIKIFGNLCGAVVHNSFANKI